MGSGSSRPNSPTSKSLKSSDLATSLTGSPSSAWIKWVYLGLAVAGGVLTWLANFQFIKTYGGSFDIGLYINLATANPGAQSLSWDLLVTAFAITIWIVGESRRLKMRGLFWILLSCFAIAFAFGAPLFLFLRERRLLELSTSTDIN